MIIKGKFRENKRCGRNLINNIIGLVVNSICSYKYITLNSDLIKKCK